MEGRVRVVIMALAATCSLALALVNAYHIAPVSANQSGWTRRPPHPGYYVAEVITCNFDLP